MDWLKEFESKNGYLDECCGLDDHVILKSMCGNPSARSIEIRLLCNHPLAGNPQGWVGYL